jgi:hypothetical protein
VEPGSFVFTLPDARLPVGVQPPATAGAFSIATDHVFFARGRYRSIVGHVQERSGGVDAAPAARVVARQAQRAAGAFVVERARARADAVVDRLGGVEDGGLHRPARRAREITWV